MSGLVDGLVDAGVSFGRLFKSRAFYGFLSVLLCFIVPAIFIFTSALKYDVILQLSQPVGITCLEIPQALLLTTMLMVLLCCLMFVLALGEYVCALRWQGISHRSYGAHMRTTVYYCLAIPVFSLCPIWIMTRYC